MSKKRASAEPVLEKPAAQHGPPPPYFPESGGVQPLEQWLSAFAALAATPAARDAVLLALTRVASSEHQINKRRRVLRLPDMESGRAPACPRARAPEFTRHVVRNLPDAKRELEAFLRYYGLQKFSPALVQRGVETLDHLLALSSADLETMTRMTTLQAARLASGIELLKSRKR
jgi:hypothetical protein